MSEYVAVPVRQPSLNDFVYTVLYNADYQSKKGLPVKYLKIALSEKDAKKFCSVSSQEEKLLVLSYLGFECYFVISKKDIQFKRMKEILTYFDSKKESIAMREIAESGIFVTGSKEYLRLLGLMSQSVHHSSFALNLNLARQGFNLNKWSKRNINSDDVLVREIDEFSNSYCSNTLSTSYSFAVMENAEGLRNFEMMILLYLYKRSNTYIKDEVLITTFYGMTTKRRLRFALRLLLRRELIKKGIIKTEIEYTTTSQGTVIVQRFIKTSLENKF